LPRCGSRPGGWLGLLLIYFIAPRARKFAQFTLPDLLEARYNQTARVLGTIAILFAYIGITSYQFKGGGDVLHLIFPDTVTPELGTYIIAAFVILTTALAGMSSVAYMDVAIGSLVTVICIIAAPMLFLQAGGWAGCTPRCRPSIFKCWATTAGREHGIRQSAGMGVIRGWSFWCPPAADAGQPGDVPEVFLGQSEKDARISVVGWILGTVVLETLIVAIASLAGRSIPPAKWRCIRARSFPTRRATGCPR
jgi:SSS family solute:Na+ symporter